MPNTEGLKRGGSRGRPKGAKNKATIEAKALAREMVLNPEYLANLRTRLVEGKLAPGVESLIWLFAFGRPKNVLDVTVDPGKVIEVVLAAPQEPKRPEPDAAAEHPDTTSRPAEPTLVPRPPDPKVLDRTDGPPVWPAGPGRKPRW